MVGSGGGDPEALSGVGSTNLTVSFPTKVEPPTNP
jgi:hypothetical protein